MNPNLVRWPLAQQSTPVLEPEGAPTYEKGADAAPARVVSYKVTVRESQGKDAK